MDTIGLIGGMSWHSTMTYYRVINEKVAAARGGHASAHVLVNSVDFAEIRACQVDEDWERAGTILAEAGQSLERAGADVVAICTNLMHKVAPAVESALSVPLLHIADAVAAAATDAGFTRLGLMGARWTVEETFYADRLAAHGIEVVTSRFEDRALVDRVIFDELTVGVLDASSRADFVRIVDDLAAAGAHAVVLACTEIALLVGPDDASIPLIDSAEAHAHALAERALAPTLTARSR